MNERVRRLSLIDESGERYVRMANLAAAGSHAINGVAALHTKLLEEYVLRDFYEMYPERFSNKTNGVTPRRWLALANPGLASTRSPAKLAMAGFRTSINCERSKITLTTPASSTKTGVPRSIPSNKN